MKNNHHPTQYTMKDLFAALDPISPSISLRQSKKQEELKENRDDRAAKDDSKSAAMGGMNSSSIASLHLPTHHYTMEDLFEALDPMSLTNRSRIQLGRESNPQMNLQPQQQRQVQQSKQHAATTTGLKNSEEN